MNDIYEEIRRCVRGVVRRNEPMRKHTSFGIGGPADLWVEPDTLNELFVVLNLCRGNGVPYVVIGRGSNLLVRDGGVRGAVICLNRACDRLERKEEGVVAGAGISLLALVKFALRDGLQGLEFCVGIPGSVGGALATNAGAWGSSITDFVESALVYDPVDNERRRISKSDIEYGYRKSTITASGIVLEAEFHLAPGDPAEISERMNRYLSQRANTQPLRARSAGSVFKNPSGSYAGAIIEQLGFKGRTRGGAAISDIHANFIINAEGATAADVLGLIAEVKRRAREEMHIELEEEIRVIGEG
jgi:UDP-N-acetylmuramate dehydrogenase